MSKLVERRVAAWELAFEIGAVSREPQELLALGRRIDADTKIPTQVLHRLIELVRQPPSEPALARTATAAPEPPVGSHPDRSGRAGTNPDRSGRLVDWALQQAARAGKTLRREGSRGQTYRTADGRAVHVRTMRRHKRGAGRYSYWFGIAEELWNADDLFMLVCDTDAVIVVPVQEWLPVRALIAPAKGGTERQPSVWQVEGRFELRASGEHFDITEWCDRFDLL